MGRLLDVNPRLLLAATTMQTGADPGKLHRQIAQYGKSTVRMPALEVEEDAQGRLRILNGMTRATRVAMLLPGTLVTVEVTEPGQRPFTTRVTIGDLVP